MTLTPGGVPRGGRRLRQGGRRPQRRGRHSREALDEGGAGPCRLQQQQRLYGEWEQQHGASAGGRALGQEGTALAGRCTASTPGSTSSEGRHCGEGRNYGVKYKFVALRCRHMYRSAKKINCLGSHLPWATSLQMMKMFVSFRMQGLRITVGDHGKKH